MVLLGGIQQFPGSLLFYVGGSGPLVAALLLIHVSEDAAARRSFWSRTFDPRTLPGRWLLVALLLHPLVLGLALAADVVAGAAVALQAAARVDPFAIVGLALGVLVFGPLPEEMGWRGVALDRLQRRWSGLAASLILAVAWALWHVPLFFIDGTFQHGLGFGSVRFWIFMGDLVPLTVLITWVYNRSGRSILGAVLVHFSGNLCGALLAKTDRLAALEMVALALAAVLVLMSEGPALGREETVDVSPGRR